MVSQTAQNVNGKIVKKATFLFVFLIVITVFMRFAHKNNCLRMTHTARGPAQKVIKTAVLRTAVCWCCGLWNYHSILIGFKLRRNAIIFTSKLGEANITGAANRTRRKANITEEHQAYGLVFSGGGGRIRLHFCPKGRNRGFAPSSRREQGSTGALHLITRIRQPFLPPQKTAIR